MTARGEKRATLIILFLLTSVLAIGAALQFGCMTEIVCPGDQVRSGWVCVAGVPGVIPTVRPMCADPVRK